MKTLLLIIALLGAVPPLSDTDRGQLEVVSEKRIGFDEAGLYPLLNNAMQWGEHEEGGATIPDYPAIRANPAAFRGELMLIEGEFVRVGAEKERLSRPGPWEAKLRRWVVKPPRSAAAPDTAGAPGTSGAPGATDELVVVLLVDPPNPPLPGLSVRLAGRFLKVWDYSDVEGGGSSLVFVGRDARVLPGSGSRSLKDMGPLPTLLIVVVAGGIALVLLRRVMSQYSDKRMEEIREQREERAEQLAQRDEEESQGPPLPEDPVAAMEELARRRKADAERENQDAGDPRA